jgi:ribosomal protein S18 acetylase RimI-like enzyme
MSSVAIRNLTQGDFFWLKDFDCSPLAIERDSIYLFFCVHFRQFSFVAEASDRRILGFVLGFLPAGSASAYVHFLFVQEEARRSGVGTSLMEALIESVAKAGAESVTLYTIRAQSFYKSIGFQEVADVFDVPVSRYITLEKGAQPMSRELSGA